MIDRFDGEYRWLSNFWPSPVLLDGLLYPTVEHAYQAAKTVLPNERTLIGSLATPGQAKRAGRKVTMRPDWEGMKIDIMTRLVEKKFLYHDALRIKLILTGDEKLVEGNTWGDRFWGTVDGEGENHLGKILMEVRSELKETYA